MKKKLLVIFKFAVLLIITIGIPLTIWLTHPDILKDFNSLEKINTLLDAHKSASYFIYIALQIVQIVLCFLPGQIIQMAAGYAFGTWLALLLSVIGIALGTICTFLLSKLLGRDMMLLLFGQDKVNRFIEIMNSKRAFVIVFLFYLFPGVPKDVLGYVAGLSKLRLAPFVVLSIIARLPALIASLLFGDTFRGGHYEGMIIIAAVVLTIAIVCLIFRKRFTAFVDRLYERSHK